MSEGAIKKRFKTIQEMNWLRFGNYKIWTDEYWTVLDEALSGCPLKIACVYHDNQGRISGFRFESLKIDGKKFAPTANDVMNVFAKWLVEQFGEPK